MGLSIYPGRATWSYTGFMRFRERLAREEGLTLFRMSDWHKDCRAALDAAQDEIEKLIAEAESHRALVDAVRAERGAEKLYYEVLKPHLTGPDQGIRTLYNQLTQAALAVGNAREHRQAVVDSLGGAS